MCLAFDIVSGYHVPPLHFLTPNRDSMPSAYVDEIQLLQLRTLKVNKLNILGTRFFSENLTTDLNSDERKELKNGIFMLFPRGFGCAKILSKKFAMLRHVKGPPSDLWSPLNRMNPFLVRTLCFRLIQVTFGLKSRVSTTSDEPQGLSGAKMSQKNPNFHDFCRPYMNYFGKYFYRIRRRIPKRVDWRIFRDFSELF